MGLISKFFKKQDVTKPAKSAARRSKRPAPPGLRKVKVGTDIADPRVNDATTDLSRYKDLPTTPEVLRQFAKVSPDLANAVNNYLRLGITKQKSVVAKSFDGRIDSEATEAAQIVLNRMDYLARDFKGANMPNDLQSVSESLLLQLLLNGCMILYLDLNDAFVPQSLIAVPTGNLKFKRGPKDRLIPYLPYSSDNLFAFSRLRGLGDTRTGGYLLDSPLYFYASIDQDVSQVYADPFFNAAVQPIIESVEFNSDLRKSFRKASLPRLKATVDVQKWIEMLPPEVRYDNQALKDALDGIIKEIGDSINGLAPDEAVVHFDSINLEHMTFGYSTTHNSIRAQEENINGQISSGVKTLPSLLGRGAYATSSSIEAMVYTQNITSLQGKLNQLYSRALTLALRLMNYDVIVDFKYVTPELRPDSELEAFKALKQSRILEQLSLGLISDEEASLMLTGDLPSGNYTELSGTGFRDGTKSEEIDNPYSNTSVKPGAGGKENKGEQDVKPGNQNPKTNKTAG